MKIFYLKISKSISPNFPNTKIIDAEGNFIIPGLIDDQVHFREPTPIKETYFQSQGLLWLEVSPLFLKCLLPNQTPHALNNKYNIASENSIANYSFMFGGTNSNLDEILKINTKEVPAVKLFLGSSPEICL